MRALQRRRADLGTGDYLFGDPLISGELAQGPAQAALYVRAAQAFSEPVYPAMGNHECTAPSSANCCADGLTPN